MRAGRRGFLTNVFADVDKCLHHGAEKKAELVKWKATLMEQLDKILPLDEEILEQLAAVENSTEDDVAYEIERSGRLKSEVTYRLAAIEEKIDRFADSTTHSVACPGERKSFELV